MGVIEYLSLFLLGLSYGSTACMFACMPLLSPLLLSHSGTLRESLRVVSVFSLGRVLGYAMIALLASYGAYMIGSALRDPALTQMMLGGSIVLVGLFLFYRSFLSRKCCALAPREPSRFGSAGYFAMGFSLSLNPCAPVLSLAALAAGSAGALHAVSMGLVFGIGAVTASLFVFGVLLSSVTTELMAQLSRYKSAIERLAALLLVIFGISVINGLSHL